MVMLNYNTCQTYFKICCQHYRTNKRNVEVRFVLKVMCNHNFNIFLNQDSKIYSEKKIRQGLRTRKHYMQIFFWEILWIFT